MINMFKNKIPNLGLQLTKITPNIRMQFNIPKNNGNLSLLGFVDQLPVVVGPSRAQNL